MCMKKVKRVLCTLMAIVMLFSVSIVSLAADEWDKITTDPCLIITGSSQNHTYNAYQIFAGDLARRQREVKNPAEVTDTKTYKEFSTGSGKNTVHLFLKGKNYYRVSDGSLYTGDTSSVTPVYEQALRSLKWGSGLSDDGIVALYKQYVNPSVTMPSLDNAIAAGYKTIRAYLQENMPAEDVAQKLRGTEDPGAIELANFIVTGGSNASGKVSYLGTIAATANGSGGNATLDLKTTGQGYYLVAEKAKTNGYIPGNSEEVIAYSRYIISVVGAVVLEPKADVPKVVKKVYDNHKLTGLSGDSATEDAAIPGFDLDNGSKTEYSLHIGAYPAHPDGERGGWNDVADYSIGDAVPFKIIGTLPSTYRGYHSYKYVFHDTLSAGYTLNETTVHLYVVNGDNHVALPLSVSGNCTWNTISNDDGSMEIVVQIANTKLIDHAGISQSDVPSNPLINENSKIILEYAATLDYDANVGVEGNESSVYLEFSNDPNRNSLNTTSKTPLDEVVVFTYQVNGTKIAAQQQNQETITLAGAEFKLRREDGKWYQLAEDSNNAGSYIVRWVASEDDASITTSVGNGSFSFKGLDDSVYYLKEVVAPYGYVLPTNEFIFDVHSDIDNTQSYSGLPSSVWSGEKKVTVTTEGAYQSQFSATVDGDQVVELLVTNSEQSQLPTTGGSGTIVIYVAGGILILVSVVLLYVRKRKKEEE